jgi:hypothetical protein
MFPDIFNNDAFSLATLTAVINEEQHVPGKAGDLVFAGLGEGVSTTEIAFEIDTETLSLVPTSARGGPAPKNTQDKRKVIGVSIPHIKLEESIGAHQIQNVREFGSMSNLRGARGVIDKQIRKETRRMDLTLENLRLGALSGLVKDSDGSTLLNLFTLFNKSETSVDFNVAFTGTPDVRFNQLQILLQQLKREMFRALGADVTSARIYCLAGDNFFDKIVGNSNVKGIWDGWAMAEQRLASNYAWGDYLFGDVVFNNYRGTNDQTRESAGTVGIDPDEARFFFTGIPGLYEEYYAPADFMETVNTLGLPRYAKIAPADPFNRAVALHTQMNPLPVCLKPATLFKGTTSLATGDFDL